MTEHLTDTRPKLPQINSLDRRSRPRKSLKAEILTFWNDARFRRSPVIDCTPDGARVILNHPGEKNETIGVIIETSGQRVRTFARVAWVKQWNSTSQIAGLEFMKLDYTMAC